MCVCAGQRERRTLWLISSVCMCSLTWNKSLSRFSTELFQRGMRLAMIYKWVIHPTIVHRPAGVSSQFTSSLLSDQSQSPRLDGRRSDPPRDSSSFSSMCSGSSSNGNGGCLSPTDLFCSGMFELSLWFDPSVLTPWLLDFSAWSIGVAQFDIEI